MAAEGLLPASAPVLPSGHQPGREPITLILKG
jgi:hypothetical protein